MKKAFVASLLLLCSVVLSFARPLPNLSGQVVDSKGQPLVGASIYIHESRTGAVSGSNGKFSTPSLPAGNYLVEVSYQGYASVLVTVTIKENTYQVFTLQERFVENENVTVTGVASVTKAKQAVQPISIVKKSDLFKNAGTNIMDQLSKMVPGIAVLTSGPAIAKPVIRGLGYNRIVTVNDGIRQEGQQWGDEHGIEIDEYSIQRVEILKGPASLLYGSDAMAGVIHLITNTPVEQGTIKGNVQQTYMSNNQLLGTNANIAGHAKNGFNWNAYASVKNAKDYSNAYDGKVLNSRFSEKNMGGYLGVNKFWGYSHLLVSSFTQNIGMIEGERDAATGSFLVYPGTAEERIATNEDLSSRDFLFPGQKINHFKIASDNNIALSRGRLAFNIAYQRNQRKEFADHTAPDVPELYFDLSTINYTLQYHAPEKNGWKTSIGINGMQQQNKNNAAEVLIPAYKQFDAGLFYYTKKMVAQKATISGGVRSDFRAVQGDAYFEGVDQKFAAFDKQLFNVSGSVGLSYEASNTTIFKFNIARGYRAPTVSELASNGTHEGTNRYEYGDANLTSETSLQLDAGVEYNNDHIGFSFTGFYNQINNYIFYSKLSSTLGGDSLVQVNGQDLTAFTFRQNGARLIGFETKFDLHPHPLDWLHFENTLSVVSGRFNALIDGSDYIPFMPPARLQSELRADIKNWKLLRNGYFKIELDRAASQKKIFTGFDTETITPSYALIHVGLGGNIDFKNKTLFSFALSVNNLTDVAYQSHLSRLKYTALNVLSGRSGVFNMGRSINLKLNIPFHYNLK
jgi:iron complex outermembrane receptor protein